MNNKNNLFKIGNLLKNSHFSFKKSSPHTKFNFLDLVKKWPEIVGDSLSTHTLPLKYINKKLTVITDHSVFSHQLKFLERPIILKIYKLFPNIEGKISKILFQNDNKNFHAQLETLSRQKIIKKKNVEINIYDPKIVKLKALAENKFANIKDLELRKLMIDIFIQSSQSK